MNFYGIQKCTLINFPGEVAATLFTKGCNFRCPYCHNPELINKDNKIKSIEWNDIYNFLEKRKNVLGGVCITGGEPLLYKEIPYIINQIHSLGLKVKIDTNGSFPDRLAECNVDYIAMDIKSSLDKYKHVCSIEKNKLSLILQQSISYIINSNIRYEFRTTVAKPFISPSDMREIGNQLIGSKRYILQKFINSPKLLEKETCNQPQYTEEEILLLQREIDNLIASPFEMSI